MAPQKLGRINNFSDKLNRITTNDNNSNKNLANTVGIPQIFLNIEKKIINVK